MDHDIRSREIIARAMAGEAMTDGAGGTADPCYWYGPYADVDGVTPAFGMEIWQALGRKVGSGW